MTRIWKTNSYFVKYWSNLLKKPDYLIEMDKTNLVDSSLTAIAQAFLDSCTTQDTFNLYDTNATSPVNRLLFMQEVPRYKQMMDNFFTEMNTYQPISDHELHFYLNEFAKCQHQQFAMQHMGNLVNQSTQSTASNDINALKVLLQLYEYYEKYEKQINALMGQQQCSILLPVHHRLVQIKDLMMNGNNGSMGTNGNVLQHQQSFMVNNPAALIAAATLNRQYLHQQQYNPYQQLNNSSGQYQQPVNCYATAGDLIIGQQFVGTHLQQSQQQHFF
jgi:hypothetical protein